MQTIACGCIRQEVNAKKGIYDIIVSMKHKLNSRLYILMTVLNLLMFVVKFCLYATGSDYTYFVITVVGLALVYMIYYAISQGHWRDIVIGTIIALAITLLAPLHPILTVIAALYILVLVVKQSLRLIKLLPLAAMGILFFGLLFSDYLIAEFIPKHMVPYITVTPAQLSNFKLMGSFFMDRQHQTILDICFLVSAAIIPLVLARGPKKKAFFNYCFFIVLVPIITLVINSIQEGISDIFQAGEILQDPTTLDVSNIDKAIAKKLPGLATNPELGVSGLSATALEEAADIAHEHITDHI